MSAFLAVDWGTTNVRAWVVDEHGRTAGRKDFPLGVSRLQPGEAELRFQDAVRPALGAENLPAILCGMIGSTLGWRLAPYLDTPADLPSLAGALVRADTGGPPAWIVPGLKTERPDGGPDVMRGEETQALGWILADPARARGERLICLPGTHCKWVRVRDGRLDGFITCMTGELFDLLRRHSVLQVQDAPHDEAAFDLGLHAAGDGGALASRLFTVRSRVVGGQMPAAQAKSYLSGLLIGAEAASAPGLLGMMAPATEVAIIGDMALGALYRKALASHGVDSQVFDGEADVLSGLKALIAGALASC